ncbi:MAG: 2-oxo acid dehydrogenase subunit E2 [Polyangiaceae bacterium]|nr:2-oxo acid dehydrogenase subunit E2 [Polyangiaceae bacterium]
MSKFEFKLPDIGEGVTEGEIVGWLVEVGDAVTEDQDMVEVMTDKATVTIGAPQDGTIAELRAEVGDTVPVGDILVVLEAAGGAPAAEEEKAASAVGDIKEELPGTASIPPAAATPAPAAAPPAAPVESGPVLAAPATRKLARELGVDIAQVPATGSAGRVTREDVERFAAGGSAGGASPAPAAAVPAPAPLAISAPPAAPEDQRVPIRGLRKRIYESMERSKRTAAHYTYADEVECTKLIELRKRCKPLAEEAGVKLTFLPFLIKATVAALKKHPLLNAVVDDANMEVIQKATFDIGMAAATDAGLMVPVLRNADRLSIVEIAQEVSRLAEGARSGKLAGSDMGGSGFTITSLGRDGGLFSTPVVNYPEVGIMGVHEMKKKPIIVDDEIKIGQVMVLSWSFDHRIIDGHVGAAFGKEIIRMLENPDRLIIEMP